jgi:hypothetical protein
MVDGVVAWTTMQRCVTDALGATGHRSSSTMAGEDEGDEVKSMGRSSEHEQRR